MICPILSLKEEAGKYVSCKEHQCEWWYRNQCIMYHLHWIHTMIHNIDDTLNKKYIEWEEQGE